MRWYLEFVWDLLCCYGRLLRLAQTQRSGGTLWGWWLVALAATRYSFALRNEAAWEARRSEFWRAMTRGEG